LCLPEIETIATPKKKQKVTVEKTSEEKLEIGKPLPFTPTERHSFQEWLQLTKFSPIEREIEEKTIQIDPEKQKKLDIIDKFIEANPKIAPVKETTKAPANISKSVEDPTHLND
jgi:hypothetical protein